MRPRRRRPGSRRATLHHSIPVVGVHELCAHREHVVADREPLDLITDDS
jgi:hypothetical protein